MKTTTKIIVSTALAVPLLWVGAVRAEDATTNNTTPSADQTTSTPLTADQQKELKARLDKRKTDLKTRLSNAEQTRLKAKCKNAQGSFSSLSGRIKGIETSRTEVYGGLIARLSTLSNRLQNQNIDHTQLQANIDGLKALIATYNTDLATYKQAVSDLKDMDCAADPTAFKASLETARTALAKLKEDSKAIRTYVTEQVKPTLEQIRSKLQ